MAKQEVAKAIAVSQLKWSEYINKTGNTIPIYQLAKQVKRDNVEIGKPKIIKNNVGEIVREERKVREAWRQYFKDALNQKNETNHKLEETAPVSGPELQISESEVRLALKGMKKGKSGGESEVVTELLKAEKGVVTGYIINCLTKYGRIT